MDCESEINSLQAETIVLQSLFVGLSIALQKRDPGLADAVREAFDYAELVNTAASMKLGGIGHHRRAGEILETLRQGALPGHGGPNERIK